MHDVRRHGVQFGIKRVVVGENVFPMELLDERRLRLRQAGGKCSLERPLRIDAPMPGKLVRVLV